MKGEPAPISILKDKEVSGEEKIDALTAWIEETDAEGNTATMKIKI